MKNKKILTISGVLFLAYLCLYAFEFEIRTRTNFWIIPAQLLISTSLIILILSLKMKWASKFLLLAGLVYILISGLSQTGLWEFSLTRYVAREKVSYMKIVNEIDKIAEQHLSYVSCHNNQLNSRPTLNNSEKPELPAAICKQLGLVDCVEVFLNKSTGKYLFVMTRFIDNGYGLLYCKEDETPEQILKERIDGLEITSVAKACDNWYYVSFT